MLLTRRVKQAVLLFQIVFLLYFTCFMLDVVGVGVGIGWLRGDGWWMWGIGWLVDVGDRMVGGCGG